MRISNHLSARNLNSFNIDVDIETLIEIESKDELNIVEELDKSRILILGGGSNVLLTSDIKDPVLLIRNKGMHILYDYDDHCLVSVSAGENWHDVVMWAVEQNLGGIENLSLIPGNAGTAPIQNIGAYGVEIKDVLHSVKAYCIDNGHEYVFHNQECQFAYRDSIFKNKWKGKFVITEIILKLSKEAYHQVNTSYGQINKYLEDGGVHRPTIQDVSQAVIDIRRSKLPDPDIIGNAGSFFKNPIIDIQIYEQLKVEFPDMPNYPAGDNKVKLAAGWLIDQCGWKGKRVGDTGTYKNQALVLVNHGNATGENIFRLSQDIQNAVSERFSIVLEREVNVW